MISDNIRGTAAVAALASLAMLASAGVASAAVIGTPIAVDKTNTFTTDETVDLLGGDLGEAANFGLVGFDSIRLNAHTNGNIATAHAYVGAAFGNHAAGVDEPEVSYLGKVDGSINVSLPPTPGSSSARPPTSVRPTTATAGRWTAASWRCRPAEACRNPSACSGTPRSNTLT